MKKVIHSNAELRAILKAHWKQKMHQIYKEYIVCLFENRFCETCKEREVCKRIKEKPWIGKI